MIEAGQDLALVPKTAQQLIGIHAILHQLERHLLLELIVIANCQVDYPHTAPPELAHYTPGTEPGAHHGVCPHHILRYAGHDGVEIVHLGEVGAKQRLHFATQQLVPSAGMFEEAIPLVQREIDCLEKKTLNPFPVFHRQGRLHSLRLDLLLYMYATN